MDLFNTNLEKTSTANSVNESRMQVMKGLQNAIKSTEGAPMDEARRKEIENAARGFESIMVNQMIKDMKKAMLEKKKEGSEGGENSFGGDTLLDYTDMMVSDHISKTGNGIGIASKIYEQMTGGEKLKQITSAYSTIYNFDHSDKGEDDE